MTIQFKAVSFLFTLLLAAGGDLIISDLNPPRFFPQYWRLIQNDAVALTFAFPTIMIYYWPKCPGVVLIDQHHKLLLSTKHVPGGVEVNNRATGNGISDTSPGMDDYSSNF